MPRSPGVMRPCAVTAVASVITSPAPPTARDPRCTRCQSWANPSSLEYSHMGETAMRLRRVTPRIVSGEKRFGSAVIFLSMNDASPRLNDVGDVFAVRRSDANADGEEGKLRMRVMSAMKLRDRFRVHVSGFGFDQDSFLEMRLEDSLQHDEEGRAVVAVPVGVAAERDLGVIDLDFDLRVARYRGKKLIKQNIAMQFLAQLGVATQLKFEVWIVVVEG